MNEAKINQLTIFGVGLIGGSLAKALRKRGYCQKVVGCSRNEAHLQKAQALDVIDDYTLDPEKAVENADVILLAVPLGAMQTILTKIKAHLKPDVIITDAGSSKASVVKAVLTVFPQGFPRFVAGHPIAGREQSGVEAAIDDLYIDRKTILTPTDDTDSDALEQISQMWQAAGSYIEIMDVKQHDRVLAGTSHLPHLLAYNLVDTLSKSKQSDDIFRYAAGGFKDFTRIASSDPVMWRDICIANRDAILEMIATYQQRLDELATLVDQEDADGIEDVFRNAKASRDEFLKNFGDPAPIKAIKKHNR